MVLKTLRKIFIPVLILVLLAGAFGIWHYTNRTHWNDTYVNGNTPGNLYNNGLFCEADGMVYFSNPSDNHTLYSMPVSGGTATKLSDDVASYINADSHYVYYVRNNLSGDGQKFSFLHINTNSLCRYEIATGKTLVLDEAPCIYASLLGNELYYIHYDTDTASTLYRIKIDGTHKEQVSDNPYLTCSANGQYLYYNNITNNHNICQYDTTDQSSHVIYEGNCYMPSADNEAIYFLDCDNNYSLMQLKRNASAPTVLVQDRIDCYNVCGDTVFFQTNGGDKEGTLCMIHTDGTGYKEIAQGNYVNLNTTSDALYFSPYGSEDIIYEMPLGGDGSYSVFTPSSEN